VIIGKELNLDWRRSREKRITELQSGLIPLSGSFCSSRKREANVLKTSQTNLHSQTGIR